MPRARSIRLICAPVMPGALIWKDSSANPCDCAQAAAAATICCSVGLRFSSSGAYVVMQAITPAKWLVLLRR